MKSKISWHKIKPQKGPHYVIPLDFLKKNMKVSTSSNENETLKFTQEREDRFCKTNCFSKTLTVILTSRFIISISRIIF